MERSSAPSEYPAIRVITTVSALRRERQRSNNEECTNRMGCNHGIAARLILYSIELPSGAEGVFIGFIIGLLCLLALQAVLQAACVRIDARNFAAPGRFVSIPGGQMHVQQSGNGGPAV